MILEVIVMFTDLLYSMGDYSDILIYVSVDHVEMKTKHFLAQ